MDYQGRKELEGESEDWWTIRGGRSWKVKVKID